MGERFLDCPVALAHVSWATVRSVFLRSDSEVELESSLSFSKTAVMVTRNLVVVAVVRIGSSLV